MAQLPTPAGNAVVYISYAFMLATGLFIAWRYSDKNTFLSTNGTQKAIPLALNFFASGLGSGIFATYAQIGNVAGLHGVIVYGLSSALPILMFGFVGPLIRKRCPKGFIFTEWVRHRFGRITSLYLSAFTLLTMFLYMIAELSALNACITTTTTLNPLGAVILEVIVTTIYTFFGGFKVSFITDNFQGAFAVLMVIISIVGMACYIDIDTSLIGPSHLLNANKLGWQLLYILPVAIVTNDCFMAGFWLRTFASKTDRDLLLGTSIATVMIFVLLGLIGVTGFLAVWAGELKVNDENASNAFFVLLSHTPRWVVGFFLVTIICLSTCAFDSLQLAMVSTISNDLFRNRLHTNWCRVLVVLVCIPTVVLAIKVANDVLQIYLIADLVSAAVIPAVFLGLNDTYFWWLQGFDVMVGGLGGIFSVFIFGTIYYGNAHDGAKLLIISQGLYNAEDWGPFGAFVVAPFGGLLWMLFGTGIRLGYTFMKCKRKGEEFKALQRVTKSKVTVSQSSNSSSLEKKSLDNKSLGNNSLNNKSLGNSSLNNNSLSNKSLGNKSLDNKSLGNKSLDSKSLGNKSLGNKSLDGNSLGNKCLDNKSLGGNSLSNKGYKSPWKTKW